MSKIPNRMFSTDNPKAIKAMGFGYLNAIHYMAPASLSGVNLCPNASPGCIALCLGWTSGHTGMVSNDEQINSVRASRITKAQRFMKQRREYMADLVRSIYQEQRKAIREGLKLCVRLNGSTDIGWEGVKAEGDKSAFDLFPDVQFVDYTKSYARMVKFCEGKLPSNYHLTFSRTEHNDAQCREVLAMGGTVAVVFANGLPETFLGAPVVNGDEHDLIQLVPKGCVIGLKPKGAKAKKDKSGFVVR